MSASSQSETTMRLACPNCTKASVEAFKPFCSKRCADVDLGQWFNGTYAIPAVEPPDDWSEQGGGLSGLEEGTGKEPWQH